jgi:hypothetical protein
MRHRLTGSYIALALVACVGKSSGRENEADWQSQITHNTAHLAVSIPRAHVAQMKEKDLRRLFSIIAPDSRLLESCLSERNLWEEEKGVAVFSPAVTGDHRASTRRVECTQSQADVQCALEERDVLFDSDPTRYFVAKGVADETALSIVHLLNEGAVSEPEQGGAGDALRTRSDKGVFEVAKTSDGYFTTHIGRADCGSCDGFLSFRPILHGEEMVGLRPLFGAPAMACIEPDPDWFTHRSD